MKRGRPKLMLDEEQIKNYARLGCSTRDIALLVQCSQSLLRNSEHYRSLIMGARAERRAAIRKMQWDSAKGSKEAPANITMQIWLGKNELKQADKHEHTGRNGGPIETVTYDLSALTDDELRALDQIADKAHGSRMLPEPGAN